MVAIREHHGLARLWRRSERHNWRDSQRVGSKLQHSRLHCFQL